MPAGHFEKARRPGDDLLGEAAGLRWLVEAEPAGGARIVAVHQVTADRLSLARVTPASASPDAAARFGAALAVTHAAGALWWGCPPPGWSGALEMGRSRTPLVAEPQAQSTWGGFFATSRLMPFLRTLRDRGEISVEEASEIEGLSSRVSDGEFDAAQPALVAQAGHVVARVHGDLWTGNVLWAAGQAGDRGAVLIDPMAHGGHAETDLATLAVFGCPHWDVIVSAYREASPLADGWQERIPLHQLGIIIMHAALFGGSYIAEAMRLVRAYTRR